MKDKVIVSIDDFVGTYKNGLKVKQKYEKAMESIAQGNGVTNTAHNVRIPEFVINGFTTKPMYLQGLEKAKDFLPLTYGHEKFDSFNKLAGLAFYGNGFVTSRGQLRLDGNYVKAYDMVPILQDLGFFYSSMTDGYEVVDEVCAKILKMMGVPTRNKERKFEVEMYPYIDALIDSEDAHRIVFDFAKMMVYTRLNEGVIELQEFEDGTSEGIQKVKDFGLRNLQILQRAFPELGLAERSLIIDFDERKKAIIPVIEFSGENQRILNECYYEKGLL